jgi:hypothetical protein
VSDDMSSGPFVYEGLDPVPEKGWILFRKRNPLFLKSPTP